MPHHKASVTVAHKSPHEAPRAIAFSWYILLLVSCGAVCGCTSTRRESPFAEDPAPDLAVTTLNRTDIDTVANVIQVQGAILMGCDLAVQKPLSTPIITLVDSIREQYLSRARDLDALVQVKNAPAPESLGMRYSTLIDTLADADPMAWDPALITFFRALHTDAMRIFRDAADRSEDPEVKAFAARQLPGIVSMQHRLERLAEQVP